MDDKVKRVVNVGLLKENGKKIEVTDIGQADNGRIDIKYENKVFQCLLVNQTIQKNNDLFVFFSGARGSGESLPLFKRWSYYSVINGTYLGIADPMLEEYKELTLGWYYGNKQQSYLHIIADLISEIAFIMGIQRVILVGSSGGGTRHFIFQHLLMLIVLQLILKSIYAFIRTDRDLNILYMCS